MLTVLLAFLEGMFKNYQSTEFVKNIQQKQIFPQVSVACHSHV